jgi:hypothetical protein
MRLHRELGREQMAQIRGEAKQNRLESRLSKGDGQEEGVLRKSMAARSAAILISLFR